jgi:hypothetical protein
MAYKRFWRVGPRRPGLDRATLRGGGWRAAPAAGLTTKRGFGSFLPSRLSRFPSLPRRPAYTSQKSAFLFPRALRWKYALLLPSTMAGLDAGFQARIGIPLTGRKRVRGSSSGVV